MSVLLDIQKQLGIAHQRVASLEQALREHPGYPSIAANLDSAVRVQRKLEAQFVESAETVGFEICRYRVFDDHERPKAGAAFVAVAKFQDLVSVVYAALKYGPKRRASVPSEVAEATAFGFGYAFTGSLGVVLTVRRDDDLFGESYLDESMETVFEMTKARTPVEVLSFAKKLGPGPINALYNWTKENVASGLGADIEWRPGREVKRCLLVQRQELTKLRSVIDETSSEETEELTMVGVLTAVDVTRHRFKIQREGLPEVSGTFELGAIDEKRAVSLPKFYTANIRKTTRVMLATGTEDPQYHLLTLTEADTNGPSPTLTH